jgi:hypothetical protein
MFEDLQERLIQGLALVRQGKAILDEVGEYLIDARKALSLGDVQALDQMLAGVSAESEALSVRFQKA